MKENCSTCRLNKICEDVNKFHSRWCYLWVSKLEDKKIDNSQELIKFKCKDITNKW